MLGILKKAKGNCVIPNETLNNFYPSISLLATYWMPTHNADVKHYSSRVGSWLSPFSSYCWTGRSSGFFERQTEIAKCQWESTDGLTRDMSSEKSSKNSIMKWTIMSKTVVLRERKTQKRGKSETWGHYMFYESLWSNWKKDHYLSKLGSIGPIVWIAGNFTAHEKVQPWPVNKTEK